MKIKKYNLRSIITINGDVYNLEHEKVKNKRDLKNILKHIEDKNEKIRFAYYSTNNHSKGFSVNEKKFQKKTIFF